MQSVANQNPLRLAFGMQTTAPQNAPLHVLRQVETEAQALAVSILASGLKQAVVAKAIGKSEAYVSQLRNGRRPIPDKLVDRLCAATGSNLLKQFLALERAMQGECHDMRLAALLRVA